MWLYDGMWWHLFLYHKELFYTFFSINELNNKEVYLYKLHCVQWETVEMINEKKFIVAFKKIYDFSDHLHYNIQFESFST